jgi:phosphoenolpyruvate-protein kinase (PTS system EI component)
MAPAAIPTVKQRLQLLDTRTAAGIARQSLRASSAEAVRVLLAPLADAMQPDIRQTVNDER